MAGLVDGIIGPIGQVLQCLARQMTPDQLRAAAKGISALNDGDPINRTYYAMVARGLEQMATEMEAL